MAWIAQLQYPLALSHGCCARYWCAWSFIRRTAIGAMDRSLEALLRRKLSPTSSSPPPPSIATVSAGAVALTDFRMQVPIWVR